MVKNNTRLLIIPSPAYQLLHKIIYGEGHNRLSFFSMDHSIIAMGFLFFVLSLSVCIARIWTCDSLNNMSKREAFKFVQNISHGLIVVQFHP